jgi:hypothetical protein
MRKILLSLLFSGIGMYAMGQNVATAPNLTKVSPSEVGAFKASMKSTPYTHWFDNIDEAKKTGFENYTLFNNTIFSDSTVQTLYGDGNGGTTLGWVGVQGVGEVFDPKSGIYNNPDSPEVFSRFNPYTVDSIQLPYRYNYVREKDTNSKDGLAHDTLIFQFYTGTSGGITKGVFTPSGTFLLPELYAITRYDYKKNLGTLNTGNTVRYVLGERDSQSVIKRVIQVPTDSLKGGIKVPKNDLFAYTVSYRPGFKHKFGDTIDENNPVKPKNLHSHFRYLIGQSTTKDQNTDYEMSLTIVSKTRYNTWGANGWAGTYIPGSAWNTSNQILWSLFHATTPNLGIESAGDIKGYGLGNIYPNPNHGTARFDFALGQTENVTINVYDILGHQVATLANGQYGQGNHTITFNTSNYKTGLYLYSITAGSYSKTLKFTVTE